MVRIDSPSKRIGLVLTIISSLSLLCSLVFWLATNNWILFSEHSIKRYQLVDESDPRDGQPVRKIDYICALSVVKSQKLKFQNINGGKIEDYINYFFLNRGNLIELENQLIEQTEKYLGTGFIVVNLEMLSRVNGINNCYNNTGIKRIEVFKTQISSNIDIWWKKYNYINFISLYTLIFGSLLLFGGWSFFVLRGYRLITKGISWIRASGDYSATHCAALK